jgi:hypothetical protein
MFEIRARLNGQEERRLRKWAGLSVINLFIVSVLGVLLRYKGAFYLPVVNYKYLLNAHSHFAFNGWVTTGLFTGCLYMLSGSGVRLARIYRYLFVLNQVSSFGMLGSFLWQGYGPVSIFFSALSVVFSYWFAYCYWRDSRSTGWPPVVKLSMRLALSFLVLSSVGPFLLAYSMSHAVGNMAFYYNAIYLYLHFQYNGWFSFCVMGIFLWVLHRDGGAFPRKASNWFTGLMGGACVPAYCLSVLWTDPPVWVWVMAAVAGVMQLAALGVLLRMLWVRRGGAARWPMRILWRLSLLAFTIKVFLQAFSVIPALSRMVIGFRPVIIAYLHLVLLGFVSCFLIGFLTGMGLASAAHRMAKAGLACFICGVVANEGVLLLQSVMAFMGHGWPGCPYYLLGAALVLFGGALVFMTRAIFLEDFRLYTA